MGGRAVVVPIARSAVGGSEGRRERRCEPVAGKTYCGNCRQQKRSNGQEGVQLTM